MPAPTAPKSGAARTSTPVRPDQQRAAAQEEKKRLNAELLEGFVPDNLFADELHRQVRWQNVDWVVLGWMVAVHVGACFAPFFFDWRAVAIAVGFHWLTASIGICLGYHRLLSHRSLKVAKPVRWFTTFCGIIAGEGTPLQWSANHRLHHAQSDKHGDPHSPTDGPWWSHLFWIFVRRDGDFSERMYDRYVPDLKDDPLLRHFEWSFPYWMFGHAAALTAAAWYFGGQAFGLSVLTWAVCVRMVCTYHSTWFVNSATHLWGYRNYETTDESRNLWWVALFAYGEGWHNNHHAHPAIARAGHKWWEFDMTWMAIKFLRATGLAWDVNDKLPESKKPVRKDDAPKDEVGPTKVMAS